MAGPNLSRNDFTMFVFSIKVLSSDFLVWWLGVLGVSFALCFCLLFFLVDGELSESFFSVLSSSVVSCSRKLFLDFESGVWLFGMLLVIVFWIFLLLFFLFASFQGQNVGPTLPHQPENPIQTIVVDPGIRAWSSLLCSWQSYYPRSSTWHIRRQN